MPPESVDRPTPRLAAEDVEAIAARTAELVLERLAAPEPAPVDARQLVDAPAVAAALGVTAEWVRDHADELGVVRLGDGPRPRLRFDLELARAALARSCSEQSQESQSPVAIGDRAPSRPRRSGRRRDGLPETGSVLAVRPREEAA